MLISLTGIMLLGGANHFPDIAIGDVVRAAYLAFII